MFVNLTKYPPKLIKILGMKLNVVSCPYGDFIELNNNIDPNFMRSISNTNNFPTNEVLNGQFISFSAFYHNYLSKKKKNGYNFTFQSTIGVQFLNGLFKEYLKKEETIFNFEQLQKKAGELERILLKIDKEKNFQFSEDEIENFEYVGMYNKTFVETLLRCFKEYGVFKLSAICVEMRKMGYFITDQSVKDFIQNYVLFHEIYFLKINCENLYALSLNISSTDRLNFRKKIRKNYKNLLVKIDSPKKILPVKEIFDKSTNKKFRSFIGKMITRKIMLLSDVKEMYHSKNQSLNDVQRTLVFKDFPFLIHRNDNNERIVVLNCFFTLPISYFVELVRNSVGVSQTKKFSYSNISSELQIPQEHEIDSFLLKKIELRIFAIGILTKNVPEDCCIVQTIYSDMRQFGVMKYGRLRHSLSKQMYNLSEYLRVGERKYVAINFGYGWSESRKKEGERINFRLINRIATSVTKLRSLILGWNGEIGMFPSRIWQGNRLLYYLFNEAKYPRFMKLNKNEVWHIDSLDIKKSICLVPEKNLVIGLPQSKTIKITEIESIETQEFLSEIQDFNCLPHLATIIQAYLPDGTIPRILGTWILKSEKDKGFISDMVKVYDAELFKPIVITIDGSLHPVAEKGIQLIKKKYPTKSLYSFYCGTHNMKKQYLYINNRNLQVPIVILQYDIDLVGEVSDTILLHHIEPDVLQEPVAFEIDLNERGFDEYMEQINEKFQGEENMEVEEDDGTLSLNLNIVDSTTGWGVVEENDDDEEMQEDGEQISSVNIDLGGKNINLLKFIVKFDDCTDQKCHFSLLIDNQFVCDFEFYPPQYTKEVDGMVVQVKKLRNISFSVASSEKNYIFVRQSKKSIQEKKEFLFTYFQGYGSEFIIDKVEIINEECSVRIYAVETQKVTKYQIRQVWNEVQEWKKNIPQMALRFRDKHNQPSVMKLIHIDRLNELKNKKNQYQGLLRYLISVNKLSWPLYDRKRIDLVCSSYCDGMNFFHLWFQVFSDFKESKLFTPPKVNYLLNCSNETNLKLMVLNPEIGNNFDTYLLVQDKIEHLNGWIRSKCVLPTALQTLQIINKIHQERIYCFHPEKKDTVYIGTSKEYYLGDKQEVLDRITLPNANNVMNMLKDLPINLKYLNEKINWKSEVNARKKKIAQDFSFKFKAENKLNQRKKFHTIKKNPSVVAWEWTLENNFTENKENFPFELLRPMNYSTSVSNEMLKKQIEFTSRHLDLKIKFFDIETSQSSPPLLLSICFFSSFNNYNFYSECFREYVSQRVSKIHGMNKFSVLKAPNIVENCFAMQEYFLNLNCRQLLIGYWAKTEFDRDILVRSFVSARIKMKSNVKFFNAMKFIKKIIPGDVKKEILQFRKKNFSLTNVWEYILQFEPNLQNCLSLRMLGSHNPLWDSSVLEKITKYFAKHYLHIPPNELQLCKKIKEIMEIGDNNGKERYDSKFTIEFKKPVKKRKRRKIK